MNFLARDEGSLRGDFHELAEDVRAVDQLNRTLNQPSQAGRRSGDEMYKAYRVTDHFGWPMVVEDGRVKPGRSQEKSTHIILLVPLNEENSGYLMSGRDDPFYFDFDPYVGRIHHVDLRRDESGRVSLVIPGTGLFLSVHPNGYYFCERREALEWELFVLEDISIEDEQDRSCVEKICESISRFSEYIGAGICRKYIPRHEKRLLLDGLIANIRKISLKTLEDLAWCIVNDPEWVEIICDGNRDMWSENALRPLVRWLGDRDDYKKSANLIDQRYDFLSWAIVPPEGFGVRPRGPVEIIVRTIRAMVEPRKDFCVLATARNEGIYLAEWVSYYKSIGFEKAFIYINDCVDHSEKILKSMEKRKFVSYFETMSGEGVNVQGKAYSHCLSFVPEILDYKWVLIVDLDELFVYDRKVFADLKQYFSFIERRKTDSVAFDWINIGSNGQIVWQDKPFFERFSRPGYHEADKIKTAVRPQKAATSYPHFPIEYDNYSFIRRNSAGALIRTRVNEERHGVLGKHVNDDPDNRFAVIYHYYFKSIEEFIWKSSRNRGDHPKSAEIRDVAFHEELVRHFLEKFETEDQSTSGNPCFPDISLIIDGYHEEYASLMEDEEVRKAVSNNGDLYREKFADLISIMVARKTWYRGNQLKMLGMIIDAASCVKQSS